VFLTLLDRLDGARGVMSAFAHPSMGWHRLTVSRRIGEIGGF
jgi:hypothetical protein